MVVVKAFEELKILDKFAIEIVNKYSNYRRISLVLILLCFFSSMLITNDVALITFVPLTLIISSKTKVPMIDTIIFQTLAANIGSSLTPMGNPQNLFIFSHYGLAPQQFFAAVGVFVILGGLWLYALNRKIKNEALEVKLASVKLPNKREALVWAAVFCFIIASILGFIDYKLAFIVTLLAVLIFNRSLLTKIDYLLLVTFVCFFIFIGNISNVEAIYSYMSKHLNSQTSVYFASVFTSQLISNVPAAILLSNFTDNWRALLVGVNVGGMGTLIASLASVISYKLFIKDNLQAGKQYMLKFTVYNFMSLILLGIMGYVLMK
jgi:Na+/H+ antiporter NhaD/arsenite permease-like protein